jgi:Domain of unknown function (DUF4129)
VGVAPLLLAFGIAVGSVPVDPDAPEAQQLLLTELAKAEYQKAKPSWFDQLVSGFFDWISSLKLTSSGGTPSVGLIIIAAIVVAALVIVFLVYGVPRVNRRSSVTGALFGEEDARSAAQIRAAAERAASKGEFDIAIEEMFRAIARGLAERTVLTIFPGTTAREFSLRAGVAFANSAAELGAAAAAFDGVRYLGARGTRDEYESIARLERTLRGARAQLEHVPA